MEFRRGRGSFTLIGTAVVDVALAAPVTVNPGVALWGDSMAGDASGGGGIDAYLSGSATLARFLSAAGLPSSVVHFGLGGSGYSYTQAAWEARSEGYRYNVIDCGRNHDWTDPATVAELTAFAEALIADQSADEVPIFVSVQNDSTEGRATRASPISPTIRWRSRRSRTGSTATRSGPNLGPNAVSGDL